MLSYVAGRPLRRESNTSTDSASPVASILPYTGGLAGVNVHVDNITTRSLWTSLAILFLLILLVRLAQMGNAQLRHITSLSSSPGSQKYWSQDQSSFWPSLKKHLLYAPLNKKRHNREMQMSKAINVGTIPSRLHTLLLGFYLTSNIVYCCLLDYRNENYAALIADVRGRTGHLATINMVGLFILAGRNNPFISLLRVSFDTFNLFHRWIGRIVVLEAIAHTIAWGVNVHAATGYRGIQDKLRNSIFLQYGLLGTVAMTVMLIQSPSAIRHAFYEIFLHVHQLLAFLALLGVYVHAISGSLPQLPYVYLIIAIWICERCMRWIRIIYRNISRRGCTKVTVEALPAEACRVTFELRRPWTYTPGCHVYVYLPSTSLWMSHPFSIAWSEERPTPYLSLESEKVPSTSSDLDLPLPTRTTTSITVIISKRTGMTAKLYNKARASSTGVLNMIGFVEGPYGGLESLHSYGTVLLFAGGVGITHQVSHVRDLLSRAHAGTIATRKITLVWSVRTTDQLEWVRPWMDEILAMPGRRELLKILIFVTKPKSAREVVSPSATVQMFPGRANARVLVEKEMQERVGAMAVTVCGPGAFADDVRDAVRRVVGVGVVDFVEESFTW
ncbi:hypothetical protein MMC24_004047 [Lignoscripta atroalba]|nr:hypothetical protein [Lignoscripta atroalba]